MDSNFLFYISFVLSDLKKKIKNGPIAGRHVSVEPANSTKTLPDSPFAEEVGFMIFVDPTPLKIP